MPPKALTTRVRERLHAQLAETEDPSGAWSAGRWPADRAGGSAPAASDRPGESLPVLEAFQKYLDRERAEARRRIIGLSAFFAALLIALMGGAVVAALFFFLPWREDMTEMQGLLSDLQALTVDMKGENKSVFSDVREETERLRVTLAEESDRVAGLRAESTDRAAKHRSDMRRMAEIVKRLAEDNRALGRDLTELKAAQPDVEQAVRSALIDKDARSSKPLAAERSQPPPGRGVPDRRPDTVARAASLSMRAQENQDTPPRSRPVEMLVQPRGGRTAVRWRVSIPADFAEVGVNAENAVLFQ